jgi:hypothetical protein
VGEARTNLYGFSEDMDSNLSNPAAPGHAIPAPALLARSARNLALTVPAFAIGALAGNGTTSGRVTWPDVFWLLAPALIGLIEAIAGRIAAGAKTRKARPRASH